jgi:hypothetical protein
MYLGAIFPMLCYSHLTKNLKEDIDRNYEDVNIRYIVSAVVGRIFSLKTIVDIKEHLKLAITLIGVPKRTKVFVSVIHLNTVLYVKIHYQYIGTSEIKAQGFTANGRR